ncbi:TMF-regulated nuclear protein 1 [Leptodactylus fuscus]|uniref:TMF-regulated nuclear protein 1 n=1 Tax=Leptodactylus fuscus TaxID=238119 RepID=UPI003F4E7E90
MPLVQGSALWSLQRVFNHPRSSREPQTKEAKSVPSQASSFWKSSSGVFLRKLSSAPCTSPKRSASAPQCIPDIPIKPSADPISDTSPKPTSSRTEDCTAEKSISKSFSVPHTFTLKPDVIQIHETPDKPQIHIAVPSSTLVSVHNDISLSQSSPNPLISDSTAPEASDDDPLTHPEDPFPTLSDLQAAFDLKSLPPKLPSPQLNSKSQSVNPAADDNLCNTVIKSSSLKSQNTPGKRSSSCSSHNSSPAQSPLKSPPPPSSRRTSTQGEHLPVTPSPPWSELIEARRRLLAVEGRRRALCALEMRVQQVHCVFLQAELRVARQREGLTRLVEAAGRAEVQVAVHGQRIRRALRRQKPRLLACALCVPWPKQERRAGPHPRHPRCALSQGRSQVLKACVGGDELGTRD